jgi:hypothetical protein
VLDLRALNPMIGVLSRPGDGVWIERRRRWPCEDRAETGAKSPTGSRQEQGRSSSRACGGGKALPRLDLRRSASKTLDSCCFKSPSLWSFVQQPQDLFWGQKPCQLVHDPLTTQSQPGGKQA